MRTWGLEDPGKDLFIHSGSHLFEEYCLGLIGDVDICTHRTGRIVGEFESLR